MNHPKADVDRIYISRKEGGRGLIQSECTFKTTTIGLDTYLSGNNEKLLRQLYYMKNGRNCTQSRKNQISLGEKFKCKILK